MTTEDLAERPAARVGISQPMAEIKAELFKALGHPARIRRPSQQLAVLRRAGLVTCRQEGSTMIHAVRHETVARRRLINMLPEKTDLLDDLRAGMDDGGPMPR